MMSKYKINEIDQLVNKDKTLATDTAINRIKAYILKAIDPTFPIHEFDDWCNSDTEKPFKWNKNTYHWS